MTEDISIGELLRRGLIGGLAYGLAVSTVHLAAGVGLILTLGMPPFTVFAGKSVPYELVLALIMGLLTSPLHKLRQGRWIQLGVLVLIWLGMEYSVAVDPSKPLMFLAPPLAGLVLALIGYGIARKSVVAAWVVGAILPLLILALPEVRYAIDGPQVADPDRGEAAPDAPDVVMIVLDTVRARSMSTYGYERPTSPRFTEFAAGGAIFEDANAPATWSLPAHASLFTGTFPSIHGAHGETRYLDDQLPTLMEVMAEAGYETRCFTANAHITESFGLTRGFAWSDQAWLTGAGGRGFSFIYRFMDNIGIAAEDKGGGQVVSNVERWLNRRPEEGPPAFVFINFLEAHFPFHLLPDAYMDQMTDRPSSELKNASLTAFGLQFGRPMSREERDELRGPMVDMYDAGVLYSDALMGRVIDAWREHEDYENTVFVVLADHGEMVGEHGAYGHVAAVYQPDLRVPLAIHYPPRIEAGSRVEPAISTTGVMATILDLAGVPVPESVQVGSLMPALEGRPAGQPVLAERFEEHMLAARFEEGTANGFGPLLNPRGRYRTYRVDNYKLAHNEDGDTWLFDLATDPDEERDLAAVEVEIRGRLESELATWKTALGLPDLWGEVSGGAPREVDAAAMEQLRALGYVE